MKIAIISLGDEVLQGETLDTNATYIAQQLKNNGFNPSIHLTLPDAEQPVIEQFNLLLLTYDLILVTGGLGPTKDDVTKKIVSQLFNMELVYIPKIAEYLTEKYQNLPIEITSQAVLPKNAKYFLNNFGTASGFVIKKEDCYTVFMPGVPPEMQPMLTSQILPYLKTIPKFSNLTATFSYKIILFNIFETKINKLLIDLQTRYTNFAFGLYPDLGILKVVLYAKNATVNDQAEQEIKIVAKQLEQKFSANFLPTNNSNLAGVIANYLTKNNLTLVLAESMTGGVLAARFTSQAGASKFLLGSIVSYSEQAKLAYLDIRPDNLVKYSAVSPEVSFDMAVNIKHKLKADFAISVTGYAGPDGGTEISPLGTAYVSIIDQHNKHYCYNFCSRNKTRTAVINRTCNLILAEFLKLTHEIISKTILCSK